MLRVNKGSKKVKILLTGGHAATTAISLVEELNKRNSANKPINKAIFWEIYWVGVKKAMEGKDVPTLESVSLPKLGVISYPIITGRFQRQFTAWTIPSLLKIPIGFFQAILILLKIKPNVIVSFGGYAAFPVIIIGWLFRIRIIIHDQTVVGNFTDIMTSPFAKKVALARKESANKYSKEKVVLTGNPVMKKIVEIMPKENLSDTPTILVTGGSRGSETINSLILNILPKLLKKYYLIHQSGYIGYSACLKARNELPEILKDKYQVFPVISIGLIPKFLEKSDMVVSRAGANTVSEIIVAQRPAILIPLSVGRHQEQYENALYAEKFGIAKVLIQNSLTSEILFSEIMKLNKNWYTIINRVRKKKSPDVFAAQKLADLIETVYLS